LETAKGPLSLLPFGLIRRFNQADRAGPAEPDRRSYIDLARKG